MTKEPLNEVNRTRRKPNWELLIFAIPFTCFALYISYGFYLSYQEQKGASASFEAVEARILEGRVETTMIKNEGSSSSRVHKPRITYEYQVNGKPYKSNRFSYFGSAYSSSSDAQQVVNKYPAGSTRTAYYSPDNPAAAVLNRAMPTVWWKHFWFPAVFLLLGFLSLFGAWKGWLRNLG